MLDAITKLVGRLLGVPVSLVSLVDEKRQWFKSRHGLEVTQTPREVAFCDHVVRDQATLVIEDATLDPRFQDNPLVTENPRIRFYAGVPLKVPEGAVLGTLCAVDYVPRTLNEDQLQHLQDLAELAVQQLVVHRRERQFQRTRQELEQHHRFFENAQDLNCVASLDGRFLALNRRWQELLGFSLEELMAQPFLHFVHPDDLEETLKALAHLGDAQAVVRFRNRYRCKDGAYRWLEWNAHPTETKDAPVFASARDVTPSVEAEAALQRQNGILSLITEAQARFLIEGSSREWWNFVLERLLSLSESEYGFIGVTASDEAGPFLRTKAITNIAWNDETKRFYEEHAPQGMVFRNMNTLFGQPIVTKERFIANDVEHNPHAGGRPEGHPPLRAFAGVPIRDGSEMVGLGGLANRRGGYDDGELDAIEPVLAFLGTVLNNLALEEERRSFVAQLETSKELQDRVLESSESGFLALSADGRIALGNRRAREMLPELNGLLSRHHPEGLDASLAEFFPITLDRRWMMSLLESTGTASLGPRKLQVRGPLGKVAPLEVTVTRFRQGADAAPGLLLTLNDLQQRAALEETLRRNASLEERVNQLKQHQHDNEVLSECVEYLQSCTTLDEGLELVARSLERLFPTANTVLYAAREQPGTMTMRRVAQRFGEQNIADEMVMTQCWALRSRRAYGSWPGGHHLSCQHAAFGDQCSTFCVPLFSLDRNVAMFSVTFPFEEGRISKDTFDAKMSQFIAMAQSISGALSTIALRESLQRLALVDELTDLSNRRAFQLEVTRNIARHRRGARPFALCVLDVDHFKKVNDNFGHDAGDRVLRQVSDVLKQGVREGDLVARVGGEEFSIFFSDLSAEVAQRRLEALLQRLRTSVSIGNRPVTASIGFAHAEDFPAEMSYEALYKQADLSLYKAKEGGRDRVERAVAQRGHPVPHLRVATPTDVV
ncbi:MAG: diguanylate cyclase domain-containing protein [Myxococcota bacterium]